MVWMPKCCKTDIKEPDGVSQFIELLTRNIDPNVIDSNTNVELQNIKGVSAKIKTQSFRRPNSPFNMQELQNEFNTIYIFTIQYIPDYAMYQYIRKEGVVFKIESAENINLANTMIRFYGTQTGLNTNLNSYVQI